MAATSGAFEVAGAHPAISPPRNEEARGAVEERGCVNHAANGGDGDVEGEHEHHNEEHTTLTRTPSPLPPSLPPSLDGSASNFWKEIMDFALGE